MHYKTTNKFFFTKSVTHTDRGHPRLAISYLIRIAGSHFNPFWGTLSSSANVPKVTLLTLLFYKVVSLPHLYSCSAAFDRYSRKERPLRYMCWLIVFTFSVSVILQQIENDFCQKDGNQLIVCCLF